MLSDIRLKLGQMSEDDFEHFCCELLPREVQQYQNIEPSFNSLGKTTSGTPDAHVRLPDGYYVAFQFTTQQTGLRKKIIDDIVKISTGKCHFREKVSEVVICVNTPLGSEVELYRKEAGKHGWRAFFYSLEALAKLASKHPDICYSYFRVVLPARNVDDGFEERFYECGNRLKKVREDVGLSPSEFIEHINYFSERSYRQIEEELEECSHSTVRSVANFTGASLEWLKHNKGSKYFVSSDIRLYNIEYDIEVIQNISPEYLYFCIELKQHQVALVAQITDYKWQVFHLNFSLDFWNWIDDHRYIPLIYKFIDEVHKRFSAVNSRILSKEILDSVASGDAYPGNAIQSASWQGIHWADDIRDFNHHYPNAPSYKAQYGEWFLKVQEFFRRYSYKNE